MNAAAVLYQTIEQVHVQMDGFPPLTVKGGTLVCSVLPMSDTMVVRFADDDDTVKTTFIPTNKLRAFEVGGEFSFVQDVGNVRSVNTYKFAGFDGTNTVSLKDAADSISTVNVDDLLKHGTPAEKSDTADPPPSPPPPQPSAGTGIVQCTFEALPFWASVMNNTLDGMGTEETLYAIQQCADEPGCAQGTNADSIEAATKQITEFVAPFQKTGKSSAFDEIVKQQFAQFCKQALAMKEQPLCREAMHVLNHMMLKNKGATLAFIAEPKYTMTRTPFVDGKADNTKTETVPKLTDLAYNPMKPTVEGPEFQFVIPSGDDKYLTIVIRVQTPKCNDKFKKDKKEYTGKVWKTASTPGHFAFGKVVWNWIDPEATGQYVLTHLVGRAQLWNAENWTSFVTGIMKSQGKGLETLMDCVAYTGDETKKQEARDKAQATLDSNPKLKTALETLAAAKFNHVFETADGLSNPNADASASKEANICQAEEHLSTIAIGGNTQAFATYLWDYYHLEFAYMIANKPDIKYFEALLHPQFTAYSSPEFQAFLTDAGENSSAFKDLSDPKKAWFSRHANEVLAKLQELNQESNTIVQDSITTRLRQKVDNVFAMSAKEDKKLKEKLTLACNTLIKKLVADNLKNTAERLKPAFDKALESLQQGGADINEFKDAIRTSYSQDPEIRKHFMQTDTSAPELLKTNGVKAAQVVVALQKDAEDAAAEETKHKKLEEKTKETEEEDEEETEEEIKEPPNKKHEQDEEQAARLQAEKDEAARKKTQQEEETIDEPPKKKLKLVAAEEAAKDARTQIAALDKKAQGLENIIAAVANITGADTSDLKRQLQECTAQRNQAEIAIQAAESAVQAAKDADATKDDQKKRDDQELDPRIAELEGKLEAVQAQLRQAEAEKQELKRKFDETTQPLKDLQNDKRRKQRKLWKAMRVFVNVLDTSIVNTAIDEKQLENALGQMQGFSQEACEHLKDVTPGGSSDNDE